MLQSAHLAMIDTLMMAYTVEMVSVEKVTACIHQYSPSDAELETPYDTEDAVATWINRVSHSCTGLHGFTPVTPGGLGGGGVEVMLQPKPDSHHK